MHSSLKTLILSSGFSLCCAGLVTAASLTDNFDSDTVGDAPADPSATASYDLIPSTDTSSILVDDTTAVSDPNSLQLLTTGDAADGPDYAYLLGGGSYVSTTSPSIISYDFQFSSADENSSFFLTSASATIAEVGFYDGTVISVSGADDTVAYPGTVSAGTWYNLSVDTDLAAGTYSFTVSTLGASPTVVSSGPLDVLSTGAPTNLLITSGTTDTDAVTQSLYVDNLSITSIPEPTDLRLIVAGALLLLAVVRFSRHRKETSV